MLEKHQAAVLAIKLYTCQKILGLYGSNLGVFGFVLLVIESGETTSDCHVTSEFSTSQCIFYPVKEEEREVLLGAAQTNSDLTTGTSTDAMQTEHQTTECNLGESLSFPVIILFYES